MNGASVCIIFYIHFLGAICYRDPGVGWRWQDRPGKILDFYDDVRLDLDKDECQKMRTLALALELEVEGLD